MQRVGILALQGDFEAHARAFTEAGAECREVRTARDLDGLDGLVIPGGESTTMLKLLAAEDLVEPLRKFGLQRPVFGTCAGAILLAREVTHPEQPSLGLVDIGIERNAYGRQVHSRVARIRPEPAVNGDFGSEEMEAVFIRAPVIRRVGEGVRVLARYEGDPVLIDSGRHLVATFHPELSADRRVQRLFLKKV